MDSDSDEPPPSCSSWLSQSRARLHAQQAAGVLLLKRLYESYNALAKSKDASVMKHFSATRFYASSREAVKDGWSGSGSLMNGRAAVLCCRQPTGPS